MDKKSLMSKTVLELRDLARKKKLDGHSKHTRKEDLVNFIIARTKKDASSPSPNKTMKNVGSPSPNKTKKDAGSPSPNKTKKNVGSPSPNKTMKNLANFQKRVRQNLLWRISAMTGRHVSFYNDWSNEELQQRLDSLLNIEDIQTEKQCKITPRQLSETNAPRFYITAYFSKNVRDRGLPLSCLIDTGDTMSSLPDFFIEKLKLVSTGTALRTHGGNSFTVKRNIYQVFVTYGNCKPTKISVTNRGQATKDGCIGMNWLLKTKPLIQF